MAPGFTEITAELRECRVVNRYTVTMALAQNADHGVLPAGSA
jgi:hypothetical protein